MLASLLVSLVSLSLVSATDYIHSPIRYHSQSDAGTYNYGYDTGLYGSHQFHQENKDSSGQVNGRYGYTDPYGKLRVIYYKSGPQGFQIVRDTGATTATRSGPKKPDVGRVNTIERYIAPSRSPNKPVYSSNYYRKPERLQTTPSRPVPRRQPLLSRTYRNSGSENSRLYIAGRDYGDTRSRSDARRPSSSFREVRPIVRVESPRSQFHPATHSRANPAPTPVLHRHEFSRGQPSPVAFPMTSTGNYDHLHRPYSYEVPISAPETHVRESVSVSHLPTIVSNDISVPDSFPAPIAPKPIPVPPVVLPPYESSAVPPPPVPHRRPTAYSGRGILSPSARLRLQSQLRSGASTRVERSLTINGTSIASS